MSSWPYLTWLPPNGAPQLELGQHSPFMLPAPGPTGLLSTLASADEAAAPAQRGSTITATMLNRRTVTTPVDIVGTSREDVWAKREQFAASMWSTPTLPGVAPALGILRLHRPGMPAVEVDAAIIDSPRGDRFIDDTTTRVEVEWWIPDPRWRRPVWETFTLEQGGGFHGPFHGPFFSLGANVSVMVFNSGTAPAPIVARIFGVLDTPRLILLGSGATFEIDGPVADGDHLLVDTSENDRRVQLVEADGTITDASRRLNRELSDFWELPPGWSTVRLEADDNPSGRAVISWQPRLAGV